VRKPSRFTILRSISMMLSSMRRIPESRCGAFGRLGALVSRQTRSGLGPDPGSADPGPRVVGNLKVWRNSFSLGRFFISFAEERQGTRARRGRHRRPANTGWRCISRWQRLRGVGVSEQGLEEEGIEQMRQGLAAYSRHTGAEVIRPHFLALLAEALGKGAPGRRGLRVSEEALAMAHRNGERYYEAELYRLKGELLLMQSTGRSVSRAAPVEKRWLRPSRLRSAMPKAV